MQARDRTTVVVGVDGSPSSFAALRWAMDYAQLRGFDVVAVSTWALPSTYGWVGPLPEGIDFEGDTRAMLQQSLASAVKEHEGVVARGEVVEGHPAPVLSEMSKSAALLVVGSRGHGEFAGMLIGSVSQHVVSHAHCPVVVVR